MRIPISVKPPIPMDPQFLFAGFVQASCRVLGSLDKWAMALGRQPSSRADRPVTNELYPAAYSPDPARMRAAPLLSHG